MAADTPAVAHDIRTRVRVAQMVMIFEQTSVAVFAATAYAVALAFHLQGTVDRDMLVLWLALKVLVVIPRIAHGWVFKRRRSMSLAWLSTGRAMLLLDGFVWGLAGALLVPEGDAATITLIAASLAGVSAVAAFVLHAEWSCCVAYTVPMQLPGVITLFARGDEFGLYGGVSILIFLALLLVATRRSERQVVEMLTLRFENEDLTDRLSKALALAQRENRAKNEFVANMSHELRTPLHGILGMSSMLMAAPPGSSNREGLGVIRRCGEHLLGLINNILEYSRIGAHGIDIRPEPADLHQLISDTVEMCVPSAQEKGLLLGTQIELPRPCMAMVDPFRVRQVLLNLVGNAVKFTERGGVQVFVMATDGGSRVRISVQDTGVGIAEEAHNRIFEPFVQMDSSNTRRFGGTGLGLSISRAICEAMGASISYRSALGQGSTFEVSMPLKRLAAAPATATAAPPPPAPVVAPPPAPPPPATAAREPSLRGHVLLAEDNEVNAIVAESSLAQLGLSVDRVDSGIGVVERLCQTHTPRPDLVLLDCQMPEMDGFEAARRVRAHEAEHGLPRVPLVALTANVFPEDRAQCLAAGMDDFLAKPFSTEQLRIVITPYLGAPATLHA